MKCKFWIWLVVAEDEIKDDDEDDEDDDDDEQDADAGGEFGPWEDGENGNFSPVFTLSVDGGVEEGICDIVLWRGLGNSSSNSDFEVEVVVEVKLASGEGDGDGELFWIECNNCEAVMLNWVVFGE